MQPKEECTTIGDIIGVQNTKYWLSASNRFRVMSFMGGQYDNFRLQNSSILVRTYKYNALNAQNEVSHCQNKYFC